MDRLGNLGSRTGLEQEVLWIDSKSFRRGRAHEQDSLVRFEVSDGPQNIAPVYRLQKHIKKHQVKIGISKNTQGFGPAFRPLRLRAQACQCAAQHGAVTRIIINHQ